MALAFSSLPSDVQIQTGPDLPEITTEGFGFQTIAGDSKVRLLPTPWPSDNLPPPTASLLSIASGKGLLAAAGPESVVIASTDSVRQAYTGSSGDRNLKSFTPQLSLNLGMRMSQVAFSADEEFLVLSAQDGGGLAVYAVAALMNGETQSAFELSTNGMPLRQLVPNPTVEKAEFFALVTSTGQVMMAKLKTRELLSTGNSPILREGVSCISWSPKGKQLVAGLGDGSCFQMTPEGEEKAKLPRPLNVEGDQHVSSVMWLENDVFLVAHTPSSQDPGNNMNPDTSYNLITRTKAPHNGITFQKLPDPCHAFGMVRGTPYQFIQRLKEFPPNLQDVIIVASTGSGDIGLVTRSTTALTSEAPAEQITNIFTTTSIAEDSRRAQLPMTITEELVETSPIGVAIDLSSNVKVLRPLPKEEFDESAGALPALMILNNEGVLMTWWIVYAESIRQKTSFPGLAALSGMQLQQPPTQRQASPFGSLGQGLPPASGQNAFGRPPNPSNAFGAATSKPSTPAFGAVSASSSAFGSASALGKPTSLWSGASNNSPSASAFGTPSFGSSTAIGSSTSGPAFGQTGGLARPSVWGSPQSGVVFGQTGSMGNKAAPFGAPTVNAFGSTDLPAGSASAPVSGFASFASKPSGFLAAGPSSGQNAFGNSTSGSIFGSSPDASSPFGQIPREAEAPKSILGGGSRFTLGSTFKGDGTASSDEPKPTAKTTGSMFGSDFSATLGKTQTEIPQMTDADMDDDVDNNSEEKAKDQGVSQDTTESSNLMRAPKTGSPFPPTAPPKSGGLFGTQSQGKTTPAEVGTSKPASILPPGNLTPDTIAAKEIHVKAKDLPAMKPSPKIKAEPEDLEDESFPISSNPKSKRSGSPDAEGSKTPETPLPPESTSKASFAPGDSSNSSKSSNEEPSEPPLPPEPLLTKTKLSKVESVSAGPSSTPGSFPSTAETQGNKDPASIASELPKEDEDEGLDTDGSGVDVAQEFSSPSDETQSPKITPETSFTFPKSPAGGLFSTVMPQQSFSQGPPLFGEVATSSSGFGKPSAPFFPPPSKTQESPRSPSPVRQSQLSLDALRPDNSRSVSAPGPLKSIAHRKAAMTQLSVPPKQPQPSSTELRKQEEQRIIAERAKQAAEEKQSLSDDEDEQVRRELETPVTASRSLDHFLAHQDYVGHIDKPGIPGQVEKVYRDINSMIDTLGLNARSLTAFVKGHTEKIDNDEISADSLEHPDEFVLDEIPEIIAFEAQLSDTLDGHRLLDVEDKLSTCRDIRKDIQSLHHRRNDMTKAIELRNNAESLDSSLSGPLSLEQASQQHDLRKKFSHFQRLLAQAEEDITNLRAKVASCEQSRPGSSAGLPGQKKPTVEAVTKTIVKMTSMVEKRSGDIDMLEAQLKGLRLPSAEVGQGSREGSPFAASNGRKPGALKGKVAGRSLHEGGSPAPRSSPLRRSLNGNGSPKKGTDSLAADEISQYREKARRRKEINTWMRQAFEKSGPRIRTLD